MPKKKAVRRKVAARLRRPVRATKGPAAARVGAKKKARVAARRATPRPKRADLGRARVSGTAELDQYFLKDYEARQVFVFLGVKTLKELEGFSPQEIIERLTAPMVQTVNRIRKALALQNRCLANDQQFALQFKQQMQAVMGR